MKIRDKLSIQFTILVAAIFLLLCLMIYYVSALQHRKEFFKELRERALVTAYIYLEEDGFPEEVYKTISERYIQTLPNEIAQFYDAHNQPKFFEVDVLSLSKETIGHIRENYAYPEVYEFYIGNVQAVGLFYPDNQGDYVVVVAAVDTTGETFLNNLAWILITGFSICLIVILFSGRFFAKQALKPIPKIVNQVNRISASSLNVRLQKGIEHDELGELVQTFNELLSRLEENFNVQKRFVANASHELRTPLTSIIGGVEVALIQLRSKEEYIDVLNSIHHDALTLHELISVLLDLAQIESEQLNRQSMPVRVDELVMEAAIQIEKKYPGTKINISYQHKLPAQRNDFLFLGSSPLLYNVFLNVLDNAAKFSLDTPVVDVRLLVNNNWIQVEIKDYGIGISEEDIDKIFDPFYRSSRVITKKGYGIGLSFVKRVLTALNGTITYESQIHKGAKANIVLHKHKTEGADTN